MIPYNVKNATLCTFDEVRVLTSGETPICEQNWVLSIARAQDSCSVSGTYTATFALRCFYGKPTCYFAEQDGLMYDTQSIAFEIDSSGICPEVVEDLEVSAVICDTGSSNMDVCSDGDPYISGTTVFYRIELDSTLAVINSSRITEVYISQDMSSIHAISPDSVTSISISDTSNFWYLNDVN